MPREPISAADAAAAAVAEAETAAERAAAREAAKEATIAVTAKAEQTAVYKRGADIVANSRDRALELDKDSEIAAFEAERLAAKMAKAATEKMEVPKGWVRVRVTALGHGKLFTGEDLGPDGERFPTYHRGAEPPLPLEVAKRQCALGHADFVDE